MFFFSGKRSARQPGDGCEHVESDQHVVVFQPVNSSGRHDKTRAKERVDGWGHVDSRQRVEGVQPMGSAGRLEKQMRGSVWTGVGVWSHVNAWKLFSRRNNQEDAIKKRARQRVDVWRHLESCQRVRVLQTVTSSGRPEKQKIGSVWTGVGMWSHVSAWKVSSP